MNKKLLDAFYDSKFYSTKHKNYFPIYELLFQKYIGKNIVFVEIGIFSGGSLFMWRNFFGRNARIIGVEVDPSAKQWEDFGFEIFIGDSGSENFWDNFYKKVGNVDIIIDDGSHTSHDQITGVAKSINYINDGGTYLVEDTHSSYLKKYDYSKKYTFMDFSKRNIDHLNYRFPGTVKIKNEYMKNIFNKVYSMRFFESMCVYEINSKLCNINEPINNGRKHMSVTNQFNYLHTSKSKKLINFLAKKFYFLKKYNLIIYSVHKINKILSWYLSNKQNKKLKKFFSKSNF